MTKEKILVVDDEKTVCNSINKILSRKGYTVDKSLNADEAMKRIKKNTAACMNNTKEFWVTSLIKMWQNK